MSSRPDCKLCGETITMGGCSCGEPYFGHTKIENGKIVKDERPHVHVSWKAGTNGQKYGGCGWVPKEEEHLWKN